MVRHIFTNKPKAMSADILKRKAAAFRFREFVPRLFQIGTEFPPFIMIMRTITLQDIKRRGAKAIPDDAPVFLIVNSKPKSVLLPVKDYESLMDALEELEDIKSIEERKHEKPVPESKVFPNI